MPINTSDFIATIYDPLTFPTSKSAHPAPESSIRHQGVQWHSLWLVPKYSSGHLSVDHFMSGVTKHIRFVCALPAKVPALLVV